MGEQRLHGDQLAVDQRAARRRRLVANLGWLVVSVAGLLWLWVDVRDVEGLARDRAIDVAVSVGTSVLMLWPIYGLMEWLSRRAVPERVGLRKWDPDRTWSDRGFDVLFSLLGVVAVGLLSMYHVAFGIMAVVGLAFSLSLDAMRRLVGPGFAALLGFLGGAGLIFIGLSMWSFYAGFDSGIDPGPSAFLAFAGPGVRIIFRSVEMARGSWKIYRGAPRGRVQ